MNDELSVLETQGGLPVLSDSSPARNPKAIPPVPPLSRGGRESGRACRRGALIAALFIVVVAALCTPGFLDRITEFGHYIPQEDLPTDYLKGCLWSLLLALSILLWPVSPANRKRLLQAWLAKIVMTLGIMLFYESHYGLDAYMYFTDSNKAPFSFSAFTMTGSNAGTYNIVNLCRLNNYLVPDSYHALKVSFAMLGLIGIYLFYRTSVVFLRRDDPRIFYLLAFFPGIFFWSSIVGKEPVVFFAIALYAFGTVSWFHRARVGSLLFIAAGVFLGTIVRVWLGPIMMLPLMVLLMKSSINRLVKGALILVACAALALTAGPMMERFRIQALEDVFAAADRTTQGFVTTEGGSTQNLQVDLSSPAGAVKFLPQAAFTALFRPLPGEVMNPFGLLAGLESAILLFLLVRAVRRTRLRELSEPLVAWSLSFTLIWSLTNGIVSSANFGVGVRYKLQILPILLGLLLYLSRERRSPSGSPRPFRGEGGRRPGEGCRDLPESPALTPAPLLQVGEGSRLGGQL